MALADLSSEEELHAAWRRLARRLHPDACPGDPAAEERFKRVHSEYRRALEALRRRRRSPPPPPPPPAAPPARWGCPACGDGYTVGRRCPRCDVPLHDRRRGPEPPHRDPRVDAFTADLEARPGRVARLIDPDAARLAWLVTLTVLGAAHWTIGLRGGAALCALFVLFGAGTLAHERFVRWRPPAWRRL